MSSYGIKGTKHLQKIYKDTFEIKRARNEKSIFFRPYTAPSKEHILLNQHLLKTQDFKEILRDRQIKTVEVNPLDALYFEDISLSKHNNNNEFFKINNEALSTKKNNLLKIYDQKEILNVSKTNDFLKSSPNNREKKESAFDFMTSIDAKEHISHKFPARPQSSQIRKRKTSINSYSYIYFF